MNKPDVEIRTVVIDDYDSSEEIEVYVNDKYLTDGFFGGEPEDNYRFRTYSWVDNMLGTLCEALGANVRFTEKLRDE